MKKVGKAIACLKALGGFRPSIGSFEDRLKIQKVIYLLGLRGVRTGFNYSLYVRGPYSPDLTQEFFRNQSDFEHLQTSTKLNSNEEAAIRELNEKFGMKSSLLEVAATYGYFTVHEKLDQVTALKNVKKLKPFYSETQIVVGISRAKEHLFPPSQESLEPMKEEMHAWISASSGDAEN